MKTKGPNDKYKILLVEDNFEIRQLISSHLKKSGLSVECAENGIEGLDILKSDDSIAIVISDIQMPLMGGIEFREKAYLLEESNQPETWVALTAYFSQNESEIIDIPGFDDLFYKPYRLKLISNYVLKKLSSKSIYSVAA